MAANPIREKDATLSRDHPYHFRLRASVSWSFDKCGVRFYPEPARSGFPSCALMSSPTILAASRFCSASCASSSARSRLATAVGGSAARMPTQESKTRMRFNSGLAHPFTMQKFTSNSSWCLLCSCFRCDDSHRVLISILGIEIQKRKLWNGFGFAP